MVIALNANAQIPKGIHLLWVVAHSLVASLVASVTRSARTFGNKLGNKRVSERRPTEDVFISEFVRWHLAQSPWSTCCCCCCLSNFDTIAFLYWKFYTQSTNGKFHSKHIDLLWYRPRRASWYCCLMSLIACHGVHCCRVSQSCGFSSHKGMSSRLTPQGSSTGKSMSTHVAVDCRVSLHAVESIVGSLWLHVCHRLQSLSNQSRRGASFTPLKAPSRHRQKHHRIIMIVSSAKASSLASSCHTKG